MCEDPEWKALYIAKALREGQWRQMSLGAGQLSDRVGLTSHAMLTISSSS